MPTNTKTQFIATLLTAGLFVWACPAAAAVRIEGQVQGGGGPIANSKVTLWAASANAPSQLGQVQTCEGKEVEPCKSFVGPFHLGIDQQDRIWVTNSFGAHVTRFPAADPNKAEKFKSGYSGSGLAIDSQGNVWVTNRLGNSDRGMFDIIVEDIAVLKTGGNADRTLTEQMAKQRGGTDGGSVTLLRPDGSQYPSSPFIGGGLPGPWAAVVDGNDNVWISNFAMPNSPITQLCGAPTENCPPGMKTGDQISPPGGYVGGGLQMQTDLAIDPAGNVWVMNNWQDVDSCFGTPPEALFRQCGLDVRYVP